MTLHHAVCVGDKYERHRIDPVTTMYVRIGNSLKLLNADRSVRTSVEMYSF
jgi:hypothetical protein